jgi:hypothetical protein
MSQPWPTGIHLSASYLISYISKAPWDNVTLALFDEHGFQRLPDYRGPDIIDLINRLIALLILQKVNLRAMESIFMYAVMLLLEIRRRKSWYHIPNLFVIAAVKVACAHLVDLFQVGWTGCLGLTSEQMWEVDLTFLDNLDWDTRIEHEQFRKFQMMIQTKTGLFRQEYFREDLPSAPE